MATHPSPTLAIELPREAIEEFCRRWKITELAVFGSALRDDFGPESDLDFLVTFAPDETWTLLDLIGMEQELEGLFGREVDLVERISVERSHNWIRRGQILGTAQVLYGA
jgi:hypothetical protein